MRFDILALEISEHVAHVYSSGEFLRFNPSSVERAYAFWRCRYCARFWSDKFYLVCPSSAQVCFGKGNNLPEGAVRSHGMPTTAHTRQVMSPSKTTYLAGNYERARKPSQNQPACHSV